MRQLPDSDVLRVNLDVPSCVATSLATVARLRPFLAQIAELKQVNMTRIEGLERYTRALTHAHALHISHASHGDELPLTVTRARQLRDLLRGELENLARHGVLPRAAPKRGTRERSHRHLAFELLGLSSLLRKAWPDLDGKSPLTLTQLDHAETLADRILRAIGSERSKQRRKSAKQRARAFTLFVRAYDETRRAITFLLWGSRGADAVVPSLYASRRRSGSRSTRPSGPAST